MDYTYPSVYFAYLFFTVMFGFFVYLFVRSIKDGYFTRRGEDIKYIIFDEDERNERKAS